MRIVGFGACMIKGKPFNLEDSFFYRFMELLKNNNINITSSNVISLEGFPINRAEKYLEKKVLPLKPDIVVIQFGSVDIVVSIKESLLKRLKKTIRKKNINIVRNLSISKNNITITKFDFIKMYLKFPIKYCAMKILKVHPTTPIKKYIFSMEYIVKSLTQKQIKVVVLSPFISHDLVRNCISRKYANEIKKLQEKYDFTLIDTYSVLKNYRLEEILLSDGMHLTLKGHEIISNQLFNDFTKSY